MEYVAIYLVGFISTLIFIKFIFNKEIISDTDLLISTLAIFLWPLTIPIIIIISLLFWFSKALEWFINL